MYVLLIYGVIGFLGLIKHYIDEKKFRMASIIIFIVTMLFFTVRLNMGNDIPTYIIVYDRVENPIYDAIHYHLSRNIGFTSLALLCKKIFGSYRYFLLTCNILTTIVITYIVFKHSKNMLLSLMIFIGSGYLEVYYSSGIRQSIAMVIFLFSYFEFLENKQYLKYYIGIFMSFLFHDVALVGFALPLLLNSLNKIKENTIKKGIIIVMMALLLSFFSSYALTLLFNIVGADYTWNHILSYFSGQSFSIMGLGLQILITLMCIVLYSIGEKNENTYLQILTIFVALLIYILLIRFPIVSRVCDYLQVILIITLPNILESVPSKKKYVLSCLFVVMLNGHLLYIDMQEKIKKMDDITIVSYPYITLLEQEKCELYFYGEE